jgi:hypothetical protein
MRLPPIAWLALTACRTVDRPEPSGERGDAVALDASLPFAELALPADSREGQPVPDAIPLSDWRLSRNAGGRTTWEARLPIRLRSFFFSTPPPGFALVDANGAEIVHRSDAEPGATSYVFDAATIRVTGPTSAAPPAGLALRYPLASDRERRMNRSSSGVASDADFVHTSIQDGPAARAGLLLPAPARASWDLSVPVAAELRFELGISQPEVSDGPPSDGATLVVRVGEVEVGRFSARPGAFEAHRVNLSAFAGTTQRVTFVVEPGASPRFDYVFIADPVIATRQADPKRVVVVFVDTLRPDHLGAWGYDRPTSPGIDAFAATATLFENARSVAPWTLPTARTLLTGRHPEHFDASPSLPGRFRAEGWATGMFAGNLFLSANFDLERDWGLHHVVNWPSATEQVDRAIAWLDAQEGRDALLLVHFMDVHLPYKEPPRYRSTFAGPPVGGLGEEFHRSDVLEAPTRDPAVRDYIVGRYDNNVRYVDDEFTRLLGHLAPDDVVVLLSDHGEEFWEHGGFEHGHSLYDELLRVPLVVRDGVHVGRVTTPVSLLDVAPTLLDLGGLRHDGTDGRSLAPAMAGDSAFTARDQVFGRPLYGESTWGVLHESWKWTTRSGADRLVDLATDPAEQVDRLSAEPALGEPFPGYLGGALGAPVERVLRVAVNPIGQRPTEELTVEISADGGVAGVWLADDPTRKSSAVARLEEGVAKIVLHPGFKGGREAYVALRTPVAEATGLRGAVVQAGVTRPMSPRIGHPAELSGRADRRVEVAPAWAPLPFRDGRTLDGFDPELATMLQAIGYAVGDDE